MKKSSGLISRETAENSFPEFEPLPLHQPIKPHYRISEIENMKTWNDRWKSKIENMETHHCRCETDNVLRAAKIGGAELAEAIYKFSEFEELYRKNDPSLQNIKGTEFEWARAALKGDKDGYAYIDVEAKLNKSGEVETAIKFKTLKNNKLNLDGYQLITLDGTADPAELEACFGRPLKHVKADVQLQDIDAYHFLQNFGKGAAQGILQNKRCDYKLRNLLKKFIGFLKPEDKKVLIVTHKILADRLKPLAEALNPEREWDITHYFASRGSNAYEAHDAVIAFGTPYGSPFEMKPQAEELFPGDVNAQDIWISRNGIRELIQAIHRIRPVQHRATIIVFGLEYPREAFGQPQVIDMTRQGGRTKEIEHAAEKLIDIAEELGCMTKDIAHGFGVIDERDYDLIQKFKATTGERPTLYPHTKWKSVLELVIEDQGLAPLSNAPKNRRGPATAAAGTVKAIKACYARWSWNFDETEWRTPKAPIPLFSAPSAKARKLQGKLPRKAKKINTTTLLIRREDEKSSLETKAVNES